MDQSVFIKKNPLPRSRSLICEVDGLKKLQRFQENHGLSIPEIFSYSEQELRLEKIESSSPTLEQWQELGVKLSKLHQITSDSFGLKEDNFIGLNPQINGLNSNWGEFFYEKRLYIQAQWLTIDEKDDFLSILTSKKEVIISFLNAHNPKPSLVHGDLWSGNVLFSHDAVWLIDPAIYYADREVDLAMTKLFGGFDQVFYESYIKEFPLPIGYEKREVIYNLYHNLNHLNLFGRSYLSSTKRAMNFINSELY